MPGKEGVMLQKARIFLLSHADPHVRADNAKYANDPGNFTEEVNDFRKMEIKPVFLLRISLCILVSP